MKSQNKSGEFLAKSSFSRLYATLLILGIHLMIALFAIFFAHTESGNQSDLDSRNKILFVANYSYVNLLGNNFINFKVSNYVNYYSVDKISPDFSSFKNTHFDITESHALILMIASTQFETKDHLKSLVDKIPSAIPVYWLSMPLVDNSKTAQPTNTEIIEFNEKIKELCSTKENCSFIDLNHLLADKNSNLKPDFHTGDGIHLNQRGFQIIDKALNSVIP